MGFFKTKEEKQFIKQAKREAHLHYINALKREEAKKNFLSEPDDFNFYKELLKGMDVNPNLIIKITKSNGTTVTIKTATNEIKSNSVSDWIDFDGLTDANNTMRVN